MSKSNNCPSFNKGCSNDNRKGPNNLGFQKYKPKCQWCNKVGHTEKACPKLSLSETIANCASSSHGKNKKWLVDSIASHNMITNLSNMSIDSEYDGTNEVVIVGGLGLPVPHVGSLFFQSPNRLFHLCDTLCVPTIKKKVISIHHVTKNNNVYLEFYHSYFLVND